ncbi:MAG TPA: PD-(D/E)XK nuclease family protein, partial [Xanthobacteraceae bacterium]|nr:PD-(D/E)XK nuclease family protein [Xanthobacteraceae bacterium]
MEAERAGTLSPSALFEEPVGPSIQGSSSVERQKALQRGRIVHRLMQSLPDIPPARRDEALARYLVRAAKEFSSAEQADIAGQVLAVLDAPDFAEVFAPGSRAEVPIVGRIAGTGGEAIGVAGQVDRLIVTDDAVLIADYKTDTAAPRRLDEVPRPYIAQLALYRAVLSRIYPKKAVRAALIFTAGPVVMAIPAAAMDAELGQVLTTPCLTTPVTLR